MKDDEEQDITEEQYRLREQLRLLSTNLNENVYQFRQHIFGAIATIVEASISDVEQRKSIKDLVSNAIYGQSYWNRSRNDLALLAKANGFELWGNSRNMPADVPTPVKQVNPYEKV